PEGADHDPRPLERYLSKQTGLMTLAPGVTAPGEWNTALVEVTKTTGLGEIVGLTLTEQMADEESERLFRETITRGTVPVLPVYCSGKEPDGESRVRRARVVVGEPLPLNASVDDARAALRALAVNPVKPDVH